MNAGYGTAQATSAWGGATASPMVWPTDTAAPARQLEVPAAAARLENALCRATDHFDTLDARLTGYVARTNPPVEAKAAQQIRGVSASGLGGQLESLAERVEALANRVRDLTERLET